MHIPDFVQICLQVHQEKLPASFLKAKQERFFRDRKLVPKEKYILDSPFHYLAIELAQAASRGC